MSNIFNCILVTVTYGNRGDLVVQIVSEAISQGVDKVIIVDNGASVESVEKIKKFSDFQKKAEISLISMGTNTGSAGGFKRGLIEAKKSNANFVWLLDDDNKPENNAFLNLKRAYSFLGDNPQNIICCYRSDRLAYSNAVKHGVIPEIQINSFLDFHLWNKVKSFLKIKKNPESIISYPLVLTKLVPYGGLFFHKSWIDKVGYPDERLYLYGDDHEYGFRIQKAGGRIFLCAESKISDIDTSWSEVKSAVSVWMLKDSSPIKLFFTIRNRVFFERNFIVNNASYILNMLTYMALISIVAFVRYRSLGFIFSRLCFLIRAIYFGFASRRIGYPVGNFQKDNVVE